MRFGMDFHLNFQILIQKIDRYIGKFPVMIKKWIVSLMAAGLFSFVGLSQKSQVISAKTIDKNLARVSDSLYAYKFETSNYEYNYFLSALKNSNSELYQKSLWDSSGWNDLNELRYCEPLVLYYHCHPAFNNYPVVNISPESMVEYCKWLTELYNNDPARKFRKVGFLLPTKEEWMQAARGNRSQAMFPWGQYYLRNKKGEYLCNLKHVNEWQVVSDSDGKPMIASFPDATGSLNDQAFYTANIKSFYPNDFGIYNMSGNVAEMTSDKTIAKGGSWNSYGGEVTIGAEKRFQGSSPELGFRVFMKVIEK
jgi:sulfatase modifying factor 1